MANPEVDSKESHKLWGLARIGLIIGALAVGPSLLSHYLRTGLTPKK